MGFNDTFMVMQGLIMALSLWYPGLISALFGGEIEWIRTVGD